MTYYKRFPRVLSHRWQVYFQIVISFAPDGAGPFVLSEEEPIFISRVI
jgi:hypothetical protein